MHLLRLASRVVVACLGTLILTPFLLATATPAIDVSCGFDDQIMRHRFMPVHVSVSGLVAPIEGKIVARQIREAAGGLQFPILHTVYEGTIENRTYRVTLPNLEPLNPLTVEVVDREGEVIVMSENTLRFGVQQWPFRIVINDQTPAGISDPVAAPSELPIDWWAYDAVSQVWLMVPIVSSPTLEALGEWVVSGGSLVLFTGAAFPRMDSPTFRKLLPLSSPLLSASSDGVYMLQGDLKDRASSRLTRKGTPLCIEMPLGAGTIALVTTRYEDLTPQEIEQIERETRTAVRMPDIERILQNIIHSTPVPRPPYWIAGLLAAATLAGSLLFSEARHFLERVNRLRTFAGLFAALCLMVLMATAWAGVYAGRHNNRIDIYQTNTAIRVQSSFGLDIMLCTLFAEQGAVVRVDHPVTSYPLPPAMASVRDVDLSEESDNFHSLLALQRNERRDLAYFAQGRLSVAMSLTGDGVQIVNRTERELLDAYILFGDMTFCIPVIKEGTATYALTEGYLPEERSALSTALLKWFPMRNGTVPWLLLTHPNEETIAEFDNDGFTKQVRQVAITIIEGDS